MGRRLAAEALGAFAIVFFGCGAIVTLQSRSDAHFIVNVVFGLTVAAAIYALGHISGAHFNPAVSVAFAAARRFPWHEVPPYAAAQCGGAIAASALHQAFFGDASRSVSFGSTLPETARPIALAVEAAITFFLMLVIISVATDRRANPAAPGLAIGMAVTLCGLFAGPVTGCSMNPARSLAPALLARGSALNEVWIYVVGPILGAVLAALTYEWLRGKPVTSDSAVSEP